MTATLQYLVSEVLELAQETAQARNKLRITPRDVMSAIRTDGELNELCKNVTFPQSGVMPNIHPLLKNKPKINTRKRQADDVK